VGRNPRDSQFLKSATDLGRRQFFPAFPQTAAIPLGFLCRLKDCCLVGIAPLRPPVLFQVPLQMIHVLHCGIAAYKARKPSAGGIVDHVDQQDLFSATLQPVVIAGVPLHQFPETAPPLAPLMHLLNPLLARPPQLGRDHPLPHCFPAHFNAVFLGQVFRCQCRPKTPVHRL